MTTTLSVRSGALAFRRAVAAGAAAVVIAGLALGLAACESSNDRRVPSLFSSDPVRAGDTNTTVGGVDTEGEATGGSYNSNTHRTNTGMRR